MENKKIFIGKLLLEQGLITEEQLNSAIAQQKATGEKLGQLFIDLGFIEENKLLQLLSEQLHIPLIDLKTFSLDLEAVNLLPEFYARRFRAIVLKREETGLLVGMVDPLDLVTTDELSKILSQPIHIALVREGDLLKTIDATYRKTTEITNLAEELSAELQSNDFDVSQLAVGLSVTDAPVIKLLQTIFEDAVNRNASDVHLEPDENILRIRQRIDGVLHEHILKEKNVASAVTLRLKLMAGLNIAEKRLPQDGRFSIKIKDKNFDVRLSTMPVQFGESVVMRLLNQSAEIVNLKQIGMPPAMLTRLKSIITMPNGLLIITGPTGSGKTTSLYGILKELNTADKKIITVEDPVEYRLPRINQIQVQAKIELTFGRILRSVLRQDPDIIMIGELRDEETVAIAIRAAMTGHFVLTTLHTNDAASSPIRLMDMGAQGYLVATILRAVIAQRLVRRNCDSCLKDHIPSDQEKIWLSAVPHFQYDGKPFKKGTGCTYCHNTGYKGQIGIFELLEITSDLAQAIHKSDNVEFMRLVKNDKNFEPLVLSGLKLVVKGVTSLDEVIRMTGESLTELSFL